MGTKLINWLVCWGQNGKKERILYLETEKLECKESETYRQLFSCPLLFNELHFLLMSHDSWMFTHEKKKQSAEVTLDLQDFIFHQNFCVYASFVCFSEYFLILRCVGHSDANEANWKPNILLYFSQLFLS